MHAADEFTELWPRCPWCLLERNVWHDIMHEVTVDPYGNGVLQSWIDGVNVVNYVGAIGYVDALGPYWKFGVYSDPLSFIRVARFRDVEIS